MRLRLDSVNKVREFNGVLNEENGNVISDDIPVAFFSIKFGCKPSDIADSVLRGDTLVDDMHEKGAYTNSAATRTLHSAETGENRSRPRGIRQDRGKCVFRSAIVKHFEIAMGTSTTGMYHTLWNAFMVKAVDLLPSNLILKKRWTIATAICDSKP